MTITFETAKVSDKVWDVHLGWGEVASTNSSVTYPIAVHFKNYGTKHFTVKGLSFEDDKYQTLFWDEVKIEAPTKPLPNLAVDSKVYVWCNGDDFKLKRYFSHFENGKLHAFCGGSTSWTGDSTIAWDNWEEVVE